MAGWSGYDLGVAALFALSPIVAITLLFVPAPYGRHRRAGWGPELAPRTAWIVMESPAVLVFAWVYVGGAAATGALPLGLFALWQLHYLQRTFVFPLLMRGRGAPKPLATVGMAFGFNVLNGWLNAAAISHVGTGGPPDPGPLRLALGVALFLAGFALNLHSDAILRGLRRPGETGYRIPHGGGFRWVTSPNYLGEMVEWLGFALAAGTWAAWAFWLFTVANLLPRALSHHRWYRDRFPDYPSGRKAVLPGLL